MGAGAGPGQADLVLNLRMETIACSTLPPHSLPLLRSVGTFAGSKGRRQPVTLVPAGGISPGKWRPSATERAEGPRAGVPAVSQPLQHSQLL